MNPSSRATITSNPRSYNNDIDRKSLIDSTGTLSTSTIRPRNRRLVSTEQELTSRSSSNSPRSSRAVSPIPSKHPSRSTTREAVAAGNNGRLPVGGVVVPAPGRGSSGRNSPVGGLGGIWDGGWTSSWSALQGLASSVLGVEVDGGSESEPASRKLGSFGKTARRVTSSRKLPTEWGPAGLRKDEGGIGEGSTTDREAELRRRKRVGVLEGHEGLINGGLDMNGRFKRKTSAEITRQEDDEDALVYIHHVQQQDTLAGVVLKYNCQPAVFRKANRLWPNDTIQVRKVVVLPVDACAIKGRPCDPPSSNPQSPGIDLLAPTPSTEVPPNTNGGSGPYSDSSQNETSAERRELEDDSPWIHVRWVLLDSSPSSKPTEIARMPRKTLGYFPPRRRKSQNTPSIVSTPRGSTDLSRISHSSPNQNGSTASTPARRTSNLSRRPSQPTSGSYFPAVTSLTRHRGDSTGEVADRLGWMRGPGGVGTLTGKNVSVPGPAPDGFNAWAKKHIPGLVIDSLPSTAVLGSETASFGFNDELANITEGHFRGASRSGIATPVTAGQGLGLENAAAAIEGWVRRLAIKVPGTPTLSGRTGRTEEGDLIELLDGTGSDDGQGFELSPGSSRAASQRRENLDGLVRRKSSSLSKTRKSD